MWQIMVIDGDTTYYCCSEYGTEYSWRTDANCHPVMFSSERIAKFRWDICQNKPKGLVRIVEVLR